MRITIDQLPRPSEWWRFANYQLDEERSFIAVPDKPQPVTVKVNLPVEILPRVLEVDLDDRQSILQFVQIFGPLGVQLRNLPPTIPSAYESVLRQRDQRMGWDRWGESLAEFQIGAEALGTLVACRRALEAPRFSASHLQKSWPRRSPWKAPDLSFKKIQARLAFETGVNAGLLGMSPSFGPIPAVDLKAPFILEIKDPPSLYTLCCLELANHALAGRQFRRCANELCGKLFSLHEGRSRYGGHRPDIKYHSASCAQAQNQRNYRRRLAARRKRRK